MTRYDSLYGADVHEKINEMDGEFESQFIRDKGAAIATAMAAPADEFLNENDNERGCCCAIT